MDEFSADFLDEEKEEEEQVVHFKEQTVILIDSQPSMLGPCTLLDKEFKGLNWLSAVVKVAAKLLRSRVVAGAEDETAIVFYNTRESSKGNLDNVFELQGLDMPDVGRIRQLEGFVAEEFEVKVGSGSPATQRRLRGLEQGLWAASIILQKASKGGGRSPKERVMVCTCDMDPAPSIQDAGKQDAGERVNVLAERAKALAVRGARTELFPLVGPSEAPFALSPFWAELLEEAAPKAAKGETDTATQGTEFEEDEKVVHFEDVNSVVRARSYRKQALSRLKMQLGPMAEGGDESCVGPTIAVRLYALLHSAWPSSRGPPVVLHAIDNTPLKSSTAMIDEKTGSVVTEPRLFYPKSKEAKQVGAFPRVYLTREEARELKAPLRKGLTLLGFKPRSTLREWHQLREPSFIYPDEAAASGSTLAFATLLDSMIRHDVVGVAVLVRGPAGEPRMVALLPQKENRGAYGGDQEPPGFHLIYLPYADDTRDPEADPAFTGTHRAEATEQQVAAAEALLSALQLSEDFDPASIANPHLQRHFEALECVALKKEPADEVQDETLPDDAAFEKSAGIITAFKEAVYGPGYSADLEERKGTKRTAAGAAADGAARAEEVEKLVLGLAQAGQLAKLTNGSLKEYCKLHRLTVSGKKAELVARVESHLRMKGKV